MSGGPGGMIGNRGGTGRPPSVIRGTMRERLAKSMEILEDVIAHGATPPKGWRPADVLRAIDLLGKHGLKPDDDAMNRAEVSALVGRLAGVVREHVEVPGLSPKERLERIRLQWEDILEGA